ncbi:hypothetical protein QR680_000560 [Steinernema hermaphroditum]|uniref:Elongin-C n=1 Tax=Steinernema hermaphroditum TaxID=289476 RepID=A0AA39GX07_9BILA|nr:hypothetical protein QR680_000560 [Steinernema hermaphroditum]
MTGPLKALQDMALHYSPKAAQDSSGALKTDGNRSKCVTFVSNDGGSFTITRESAELSLKFWELITPGVDARNTFFLPDMNAEMLELATLYLTHESHFLEEDFEPYQPPAGKEDLLENVRNLIKA